jgi:acyl-CoA synthetase (NDP forming)
VPTLPEKVQNEIMGKLSPNIQHIASLSNPIDLTGSAIDVDFVAAVSYLSKLSSIDCILLLLLPYQPGISSDLGGLLSQIYLREGKPLVAYLPHVEKYRMLFEGFELNQLPVSPSIEGAVLMAEAMRRCKSC